MSSLPPAIRQQLPPAVTQKVESMSPVNQAAFEDEFRRKRKSTGAAYTYWALGAFCGLHYLYFGKKLLFVLFVCTMGGFLIWWMIDLFRIAGMVREHNKSVSLQVLREIQVLN